MPATVRPADGYVAVKLVRPSAMSAAGILVKSNLDDAPTFGRILAVGNGREFATGTGMVRETVPHKIGDVVKFPRVILVEPDGKQGDEIGLVPFGEIVCTIEGFVEHNDPAAKISDRIEQHARQAAGPKLVVPGAMAAANGRIR